MNEAFRTKYSFTQRKLEASKIIENFPDKIPIICEVYNTNDIKQLKKCKFLAPRDLSLGHFFHFIRKNIDIPSDKAVFLFIKNTLQPNHINIGDIYMKYKDDDLFLYVLLCSENTFG